MLGALTGVIGTLQAMEVIKLITGIGEPLVGRLLLYDALGARFDTIRYRSAVTTIALEMSRSCHCRRISIAGPELLDLILQLLCLYGRPSSTRPPRRSG